MDIREQELRAYVVRHSVIRIDCVAGLLILMSSVSYFGIAPVDLFHLPAPLMIFAGLVVAASTRSIGRAVSRWPAPLTRRKS